MSGLGAGAEDSVFSAAGGELSSLGAGSVGVTNVSTLGAFPGGEEETSLLGAGGKRGSGMFVGRRCPSLACLDGGCSGLTSGRLSGLHSGAIQVAQGPSRGEQGSHGLTAVHGIHVSHGGQGVHLQATSIGGL